MTSAKGKERATDDAPIHGGLNAAASESPRATCILVIGMAGSGKTTFIQRLNAYLHDQGKPPYVVNLDPAVSRLPFEANIDIRDTVDYREVMKQYNLGPNGGILTALNLFTTKFDQVLGFIEKRAAALDHIIVDTPGQIEIFTWSASGAIITDAVASALPSCVAYIVDTPRTAAPATFMSNMLYACSILYKTKLPFILVFNKTDVRDHSFAVEWMQDFEAFQAALDAQRTNDGGDGSYMNSLNSSMALVLDEFYKHLRTVGVSAMTGDGMEDFFKAVDEARVEFDTEYKPELDRVVAERKREKEKEKQESLDRLVSDLDISKNAPPPSRVRKAQRPLEEDEDFERSDDDDGDIIEGGTGDRGFHGLPEGVKWRRTGGIVEGDDGSRWPAV